MDCPSCGWANSANAVTCSQCGRMLVPSAAAAPTQPDVVTTVVRAHSPGDGYVVPDAIESMPASTPSAASGSGNQDARPSAPPIPSYVPPPSFYEQLGQTPTPNNPQHFPASQTNGSHSIRASWRTRGATLFSQQALLAVVVLGLVVGAIVFTVSHRPSGVQGSGGFPGIAPTNTVPARVVVYASPLDNHTAGWDHQDGCTFAADGLHVTDNFTCFAPITEQTDIEASVTVKQVSGPAFKYSGGIALRSTEATGYQFMVTSDGHWAFFKCLKDQQYCTPLVQKDASALHKGLGAANTLDVTARGSHFEFAINGKPAASFDETTFPAGIEGVTGNDGVEVVFTNLTITALH